MLGRLCIRLSCLQYILFNVSFGKTSMRQVAIQQCIKLSSLSIHDQELSNVKMFNPDWQHGDWCFNLALGLSGKSSCRGCSNVQHRQQKVIHCKQGGGGFKCLFILLWKAWRYWIRPLPEGGGAFKFGPFPWFSSGDWNCFNIVTRLGNESSWLMVSYPKWVTNAILMESVCWEFPWQNRRGHYFCYSKSQEYHWQDWYI